MRAALTTFAMEAPKSFLNGKKLDRTELASVLLIGVVALMGWVTTVQCKEHFVAETKLPQLPVPEQLPPVNLPGFKFVHPRLPGPTAPELRTLTTQNPEFLQQV